MSGDHIRMKLLQFNMVRSSPLFVICMLKLDTLIRISLDERSVVPDGTIE